jgi:hypothetical protein
MFSLHDRTSAENFFQNHAFSAKVRYLSTQIEQVSTLTSKEAIDLVAASIVRRYDDVKAVDLDVLRQSFSFLIRSGLITATPVAKDFGRPADVLCNLETDEGVYHTKQDLFREVNFTIKYPMFFVELLKEIFPEELPKELPGTLVGSIAECHARGLLPSEGSYEYHDKFDREIDYVNPITRKAIEFTVSNKVPSDVHLDLIPEDEMYEKILLTKDRSRMAHEVKQIPYYNFIYEISGGISNHKMQEKDQPIEEEEIEL